MIFVGNVFPTTLVRRRVVIEPIDANDARAILDREQFMSYWGHENTLQIASAIAGVDLTPPIARPALQLAADGLPSFNGESAHTVLVLSPEYKPGFRPAPGTEVSENEILGWQWLIVKFNE